MAKIDETFNKYSNFKGYVGNAPATETEYDAMKANAFSGTPPTWSDIQSQMYDINRKFEYASIKDQLDQLYRDMKSGKLGVGATTGEWYVGITSVKTTYPKP
tara:strand:+ start:128 stop:433 length:306 start_codon:yes stop_codon:yes gene_type:complete